MSATELLWQLETAASEDDLLDDLWHLAADDLNDRRAEMGMSWRTRCGQVRPPAREGRLSWGLADDCCVCEGLV